MRPLREILAIAGLAFQIAAVGIFWNALAARVPMHYGAAGTPDSYGDKSSVVVLLAVTAMLYGLLTVLSFFPQTFNYPVAVTDANRGRLQAIGVALLGWLKVELVWMFAYINWVTLRVGLGLSTGLGWYFLPVVLVATGATIAAAIVQMRATGK